MIASINDLKALKQQMDQAQATRGEAGIPTLNVHMGTCGIASGAKEVHKAVLDELATLGLSDVNVVQTGCPGMCYQEPLITLTVPGQKPYIYAKVTPDNGRAIVREHIAGGTPRSEWLVNLDPESGRTVDMTEMKFFAGQKRMALANCGHINPEKIEEYIGREGYFALAKVLTEMKPIEVIQEVKTSGLRGRGGAGFPTGLKWEFAYKAESDVKYVVCNADEGDPGAFMDRSILEGDPHSVVEAMAIAGYAIGAGQGYIYVRAEYPIAVERLKLAIREAGEQGLLGTNILGTGFSFQLDIRLGAGAFVCGEETALLNSVEGKRGEPRPRPPFPAVKGLWGQPTVLNNVETYANIPAIIRNGGLWLSAIGTEHSKGTKVFALAGKVNNIGLVEVPMGTTLRTIIEGIGGGIPNGKKYKAAQIGGPSGGCIPTNQLDLEVDYDTLVQAGAMMGSGGLIVMDEDNCMVDIARFFLEFTQEESCGKCPPCRIGTKRMLEILEKITEGQGEPSDISQLENLAEAVKNASACALGQTAPNPVLSTLKGFRHEYEAHIYDKKCPAGVCQGLKVYRIEITKCTGCRACVKACPVTAISGKAKGAHKIDGSKCIKCGECMDKCRFEAIVKE